uniref:Inositol-3,4-bisphosphate 4-phosphatase n=1 Tax=Globisporangium ultimum (strain ATCC 200006 / CBS 805.95 / DAOM BR144) TaxID=431595 RepID=K3WYN4_GLOUD
LPVTFDRTCFVSLDFFSTKAISSSSAQWTCIGISEPVRLSGVDNDKSRSAIQVFVNLKVPIVDEGSNSILRFLLHVSLNEEKITSENSNLDHPERRTALLKVHERNLIPESSSTQLMDLFHPLLEFVTSSHAVVTEAAEFQPAILHPVDAQTPLSFDSFSDEFNITPRSSGSSPHMPYSKLLRDRISMGESMINGDEPGNKLRLIVRLKLPANFDRACFVSLDYFSSKEPVSGSSSLASITRKAQWKCVGTTEPVGMVGETESALSSGVSNAIFPFVAVLEVPVVGHASNTLLRFLVHASTIGKRDTGHNFAANYLDGHTGSFENSGSGSKNETPATQLSYQMTMFHPLLEFVTSSQAVLDAAASGQPLNVHPTDEHTCTILEDHPSLQREVDVLLQGNMNNAELSVQTVMMPGEAPTKEDVSSHKNIGNIICFFQYDTEDGGGGLVVEDLQESVYANAVPRQLIELLAVERQEQVEKARGDLYNFLNRKTNRLSRGLYSSITNQVQEERSNAITRDWIDDRLYTISQVHGGYTTIAREWLEQRLRKRKEYVSLIRKNIQYLVNRDKHKQYFKASVEKKSEDLRFVPINLHIQDLLIGPTNAFINDEKRRSSKEVAVYDFTTVGAPSAHVYKFNKGGILSYQAKLKKMQTKISEADLDLSKWPEEAREYDDLQWDLQLRMDCSFAQALAALTCSFVRKVEVAIQNPDVVKGEDMLCQLSTLGFLFQVESLLSTHGKEIGMIEDMARAVANLSCVAFVVQDVRDKPSSRFSFRMSRKKTCEIGQWYNL